MSIKKGFTHESPVSTSVSWYTPPSLFQVMGMVFEIDVCAPEGGLDWIPAKRHFSEIDDGLKQEWQGTCWCNPPYGKGVERWLNKMAEHGDGVVLIPSRTDTKWFQEAAKRADCVLFLKGRLQFIDGLSKTKVSGNSVGSVLLGYGDYAVSSLSKLKECGVYYEY
jgi:phage N-6-adenine-methyltransferase